MSTIRNSLRRPLCSFQSRCLRLQRQPPCRNIAKDVRKTATPLAKQLDGTGVWDYGRWSRKDIKRQKGDKSRINIVSEELCDDVVSYMKPSLQRHLGCDLLDIYPGAGVWSRKLHEALQPRSHLLLEPDDELYRPFLHPLLEKPNTVLIPKSGIIWRELNEVLTPTYLPHQVERDPSSPESQQRNDTLLVTANIGFHPKKTFMSFDSLAQLVIFQFINSIRVSSLFQKYGLVRMLVWVEGDDRHSLMARSCQRRRRVAIEGELATDWIMEIAGPNPYSAWFLRDQALNVASCRRALGRMEAAGLTIPAHRRSELATEVLAAGDLEGERTPAVFDRPYAKERRELEAQFADGAFTKRSAEYRRLLQLKYRAARDAKQADIVYHLLQERDALVAAYESGMAGPELEKREAAWNDSVDALVYNRRKEYLLTRDNLHLFQQDPPVMAWDRREVEPLLVEDTEFFPNAPCSLLDIQPKAEHPLLRAIGPGSSRSGDMFEFILRGMMSEAAEPVSKSIETVWPGAAEGVLPHCPSLRDRSKGGTPLSGYGELSARSLNEVQWMEILGAWMKWPFRPTYSQLVARISDEGEAATEDERVAD